MTEPHSKPARICGLASAAFGLLVALITAIVGGGAVVGGLGAALATAEGETATVTVSMTRTIAPPATSASAATSGFSTTTNGELVSYTVATATSVASLPLDCDSISGEVLTSFNKQTWDLSCTEAPNGGDIVGIIAYDIEDCIHACASLNSFSNNATLCHQAKFNANMAYNVAYWKGNCWLKNETAVMSTVLNSGDVGIKLQQ